MEKLRMKTYDVAGPKLNLNEIHNDDHLNAREDDLTVPNQNDAMDLDDDHPQGISEQSDNTPPYVMPNWLQPMRPVAWESTDAYNLRTNLKRGRNCCLFYPLSYCRGMDVINGFCVFHLKAIFNLVYQTDCIYQMSGTNETSFLTRDQCFVAEPQRIDDRITAVFPIIELFEEEPRLEDLKLYNLARYLRAIQTQNWERVYTLHVNFLYKLLTVHSCRTAALRPITQTRNEQLLNSQMLMHWNLWNEYHSWLLVQKPAKINLLFQIEHGGEAVLQSIPLNACTSITQMIVRLFSASYTHIDERRFFTTTSSYGIFVRRHLAFLNNLCSTGTACAANGMVCIGNLATLPFLRLDSYKTHTLHYTKGVNCDAAFCLDSRMNTEAPGLNHATLVSAAEEKVSVSSGSA